MEFDGGQGLADDRLGEAGRLRVKSLGAGVEDDCVEVLNVLMHTGDEA